MVMKASAGGGTDSSFPLAAQVITTEQNGTLIHGDRRKERANDIRNLALHSDVQTPATQRAEPRNQALE